jgi:HAD superfamily hydrolase (TIGR01549 family)
MSAGGGAAAAGASGHTDYRRAVSAARLGERNVEALLFDYGLTLITFERPDTALRAAYTQISDHLRAHGYDDAPAALTLITKVHDRIERAVIRHEGAGHLQEIDLVAEERAAYADIGIDISGDLLAEVTAMVQQAWWEGIQLPAGAIDVLEELRRRGLRIGLCSNAPYQPASMHRQLAHLGLDRVFDSVTFSSEVGWRKPAPQLFAAALSGLGAIPDTTVMVGDRSREDIAGAQALGMGTVRTREYDDDERDGIRADAVIDHLSHLIPTLFQ